MQRFDAYYFDGKSSMPKKVTLELHESFVLIAELNLSYSFNEIEIRAKLKNTSQTVNFADGSYCELKTSDFLSLPNSKGDKFILKIESKMKYAVMSFIVLAAFVLFCLTYGSTILANTLAPKIPQNVVEKISSRTLEFLDKNYVFETKLDKKRQDFIKKHFDRILNKNSDFKLHFRSSEIFGANAFALPNGDIILLDDLVEIEEDDGFRGIIGILAHESGHVIHMHGLKMLIKSSISSALVGYLTGDFSGFATGFATAAINAKYSRDYEDEADLYAIKAMRENGISTQYMADLFDKIREESQKQTDNKTVEYSILNSHPAIDERIRKFRE
ncbi:MAG: M48 family metallopeptidase [Campylobacteraceae bacterium]|jgi:Zn-dependent protease with chaperone function|nr:M48 family metallopeptidase [Campylobacteraceae bacterium]